MKNGYIDIQKALPIVKNQRQLYIGLYFGRQFVLEDVVYNLIKVPIAESSVL